MPSPDHSDGLLTELPLREAIGSEWTGSKMRPRNSSKVDGGPRQAVTGSIVTILLLRLDLGLPIPAQAYLGDAGLDLFSAESTHIFAGQRKLIRTGIAIAVPTGYVGLVHPRSGLAVNHGLTVLNAPGTVDSGYRGEILVNLINHDPVRTATIMRGDRIAQLLFQRVVETQFQIVDKLPASSRADLRHGSSDRNWHGS